MIPHVIHHSVFSRFAPTPYFHDFLGIKTRTCFLGPHDAAAVQAANLQYPPPVDEEYFEWCDLFEALLAASDSFTMIELGAGYGRWLVRGATALRHTRKIPCRLIGVEAEPQHYQWLLQHLRDNGIDPDAHTMINKAVSHEDGEVWFAVGEPERHYGQQIVTSGDYVNHSYPDQKAERVPCVSLHTILSHCDVVDLIDMDVQGAEYQVIAVAITEIAAKVKRIHIGTHSKAIEDNLRSLFKVLGWINIFDYSVGSSYETEFGPVTFGDGVQSWRNPLFVDKRPADAVAAWQERFMAAPSTVPVSEYGVDIPLVHVLDLHSYLNFSTSLDYPKSSLTKKFAHWKMEVDDAPIFRYIYRNARPRRHLEFGTWQGKGTVFCLEECGATVWTINMPFGEGSYGFYDEELPDAHAWARKVGMAAANSYSSDAIGFIGKAYLERDLGNRVCQVYCDSRVWDSSNFPEGFFDTILVDGGHIADVVASDTRKALPLLRSGGIIMWHDFCPTEYQKFEACKGVMAGIAQEWDLITSQTLKLFWVYPSMILVGVKK